VKPKLTAILLLIVLLPLGLLTWMGIRVAHNEQEIVRHKFRELLVSKLQDIDATIAAVIDDRERALLKLTTLKSPDAAALRSLIRTSPLVHQMLLLGPDQKRIYPVPQDHLSRDEEDFLERAVPIWRDRGLFYRLPEGEETTLQLPLQTRQKFYQDVERAKNPSRQTLQVDGQAPAGQSFVQEQFNTYVARPAGHGWYSWYWGTGTNLLFWRRLPTGYVIGAELNRERLLADIVGRLPASDPFDPRMPNGRVALADANGAVVYQWGAHEPAPDERAKATLALRAPLASWKLAYYASDADLEKALGGGMQMTLISGLLAVGIALAVLAVVIHREMSREIREAGQRVSFVNQVSHELKTPLTNIRMYAELLEGQLAEEGTPSRHLGVIVSESQRLSRLIGNVLSFARSQRKKLALRPTEGSVDDCIRSAIADFAPSLEEKGVAIAFEAAADAPVRFDADAVTQILGNLFGNVEKYAGSGGALCVASRQDGATTFITVEDHGPGIPDDQREAVFEPFHRVSDKLNDGVAGTGIGLAIARELARLHGGDLKLVRCNGGACFEIELRTEPVPVEEKHA